MSDREHLQPDTEFDTYDDEELPTVVLIVVGVIAVLTVVLYLTVAGGHNHFH